MEIILPTDCGNSPRMILVEEFVVNWAAGYEAAMTAWLADDFSWTLVGGTTDGAGRHGDSGGRPIPWPPRAPHRIEILSTITHGRLAACDGFVSDADGRVDFCHVLHFTGAAKTARISGIRTYLEGSAR